MCEETRDFSEVRRDYFLEQASRVCEGVTEDHYNRWKKWAESNNHPTHDPIKFIKDLTKLSRIEISNRIFPWHWENGKRVDDHYEKIKIKLTGETK